MVSHSGALVVSHSGALVVSHGGAREHSRRHIEGCTRVANDSDVCCGIVRRGGGGCGGVCWRVG